MTGSPKIHFKTVNYILYPNFSKITKSAQTFPKITKSAQTFPKITKSAQTFPKLQNMPL